jgi:short-subunit dehydrogenase
MSSMAGFIGTAGVSMYNATKFAVGGLSEALARETAHLGIKVTIIEPGPFRTDVLDDTSIAFADRVIDDYGPSAGRARKIARWLGGKQRNDPARLAQAILRIVSVNTPPLHFVASVEAIAVLESALKIRQAQLEQWRRLSSSMAYRA